MNKKSKGLIALIMALLMVIGGIPGTTIAAAVPSEGFILEFDENIAHDYNNAYDYDLDLDIASALSAPASNTVFVGSDSEDFPFFFDVLAYEDGLAAIIVTSSLEDWDTEDMTVVLNDDTLPCEERIARSWGGVFSIPLDASYAFATAHREDDVLKFYYSNIMVVYDSYAADQNALTVYITNAGAVFGYEYDPRFTHQTFRWREYYLIFDPVAGPGTFRREVTNTNPNAFPVNGRSGNFWYRFQGPRSVPIVSITSPTPSGHTVNRQITIRASGSQPTWRMAARIWRPNGTNAWIGGHTYANAKNFNYTPTMAGTYTLRVYARSYPEADPRSGSGNSEVTFTVSPAAPATPGQPSASNITSNSVIDI